MFLLILSAAHFALPAQPLGVQLSVYSVGARRRSESSLVTPVRYLALAGKPVISIVRGLQCCMQGWGGRF